MKKSKIIALSILIIAVIGIIIIVLLNDRPYLSVSQVASNPSKYYDQEIQVIGIVQNFEGGNFNLTETSYFIVVDTAYVTIPPGLTNNQEIVVKGILNSSLILRATQILTSCS